MKCPVCGIGEMNEGLVDVCEVCHWRMDIWQEENPDRTASNTITLNEARKMWREEGKLHSIKR